MSRWMIEKSGTGIEKSGTGIEKSGTGIEKSGTGIEKSGTGLSKGLLVLALTAGAFMSTANANNAIRAQGSLQIVAEDGKVAVSWIFDGSVFSGAANMQGSYATMPLTELTLISPDSREVVGGGTGTEVVGGGTGVEVVGGGTGVEVVGGGTGVKVVGGGTGVEVVGGGTGVEVVGGGTGVEVVGGGTGVEVVGGGTGVEVVGGGTGTEVVGGGTGDNTLVVGGGTGSEAISITLPQGTGMHMEISMNCATATVSVLDSGYGEVVSFENVPVIGNTGLCSGGGSSGSYSRNLPKMR